jgi:hypothetical protein
MDGIFATLHRDGYSLWPEFLSQNASNTSKAMFFTMAVDEWAIRDANKVLLAYEGDDVRAYNVKKLYRRRRCRPVCLARKPGQQRAIRTILQYALKHWFDEVVEPGSGKLLQSEQNEANCEEIVWWRDRFICHQCEVKHCERCSKASAQRCNLCQEGFVQNADKSKCKRLKVVP